MFKENTSVKDITGLGVDIIYSLHLDIIVFCMQTTQKNSLQLKSSGVSLTSDFPLRFSGSPQVAAFSVFGVCFSNLVNQRISHVQFNGFESSRL